MDFITSSANIECTNFSRVAVLLATYNGMPYIEEQVASIFSQLNVEITLFVSDDLSTDGTMSFLTGIKSNKIVILPSIKAGSGSNNFFRLICDADVDKFDYFALSDQDDIWSPLKIYRAISQIQRIACDGYSSNLIAFNENEKKAWYLNKSSKTKRLDYLFQGASAGCTYVLTRKAVSLVCEKIRPVLNSLPHRNSHDWLIYAICRSYGLGWHLDNESHIYYRQHSKNAYGALPGYRGLLARIRLADSGWYREHVRWLSFFLKNTDDEISVFSAIERMSWSDRIWLAFHANEFRRNKRDQYYLAIAILSGVF